MRAPANAVVSVMRGERVDEFGDTVNVDIPVVQGVVAAIFEQTRRRFLPAENEVRVVRTVSGRLPAGTDLRKGDRLLDQRTRRTYLVTEIHKVTATTHTPDLAVELQYTD